MIVDQAEFTAALLDPALAVPEGLVDPMGRPAGKRFDVYRNNVVVSLRDAMETAFPVIQKLLGCENFRNLSGVYVRQHPPENPMLMFYGTAFPTFLEQFEPLSHLPYLGDVARLELARRTAYHAADAEPIAPDTLATIAPDALMTAKFDFAPACQILQSGYPIAAIWDFNMVENAPKPPAVAQSVLVSRPELDVEMATLGTDTALFLTGLMQGATLEQALETATQTHADFDLTAAIGLMLQTKIITKITT